ncbi:hypothetical protein KHP62_11070 [Rhodobacteraceae bacterium NNCM2]|nr:hypothetical protein [Coraliihabitans acroporae]
MRLRFYLIGVMLPGLMAGCSPSAKTPDLSAIYSDVSQNGGEDLRRPLITIPGTLGSRLVDSVSGTIIWGGGSRGLSADPDDPEEARLIALPLLTEEMPFSEQIDTVRPAGVLDSTRADLLGLPIELEVYGGVRRTLAAGGFKITQGATPDNLHAYTEVIRGLPQERIFTDPAEKDPSTAFRFDYDWRRDLVSLAQEFHNFVLRRQQFVAEQRSLRAGRTIEADEVVFDLLAHSMGGLVARYYLMHGPADLTDDGELPPITWEGAKNFSRVIIVASPNAGSILAMDNLINGKELGPFQPVYPGALLGTHASVWQLMPRARHARVRFEGDLGNLDADPFSPELWESFQWGLASPEAEPLLSWLLPDVPSAEERKQRALIHQRRMLARASRFHEAMDRWAPKPESLEMFLVVGGGFETPSNAVVDAETGEFALNKVEEGDGVVLRASVLLDERQGREYVAGLQSPLRFDTTLFLPDEHVELTKNPVFGDNLLFWLLEQPRDTGLLKSPEKKSLKGLNVPNLAQGGEPAIATTPGHDR